MTSSSIPAWQIAIENETPEPSLRRVLRFSFAVIAVGFGGFFGWACLAPLNSAVPATGSIVVESRHKSVTLLDPGILQTLYVREGERVGRGQKLLQLDDQQAKSQLGSLKAQYWTQIAKRARLRVEQNGQSEIEFPADLVAAAIANPAVSDLVANEKRQLADRLLTYNGTLAVQRSKIAQSKQQIAAVTARAAAMSQRLTYVERQLEGVEQLVAQGYATKTRLFELKSNDAELKGNLGELSAQRAGFESAIAQTELEMVSTTNQRQEEISKSLQDAEASAADLAEKIGGAEDTIAKKLVVAPDAGTVTDIKFVTAGSSIGAGQPILDVVPDNDRMLVEANIKPQDIEHVHNGQTVNVRLTAFKQHKVPVLTGRVVYVSADRQEDPKGEAYFLARAEIDRDSLAGLKGVTLNPGMPAEVLIIGGERKAIDYFLSPITDSLHRSLRED